MTDDWAEFVEEFGPLVYASAWRILRDRQEAEDIAQDVFTYAWSNRTKQVENSAGWLRHITVCRAMDRLRKRRPLINSELELIATVDRPVCDLELAELDEAVRSAVAALPPQQSAAFSLRYFESMTNREIARQLDTSPSAISSALHAARQTLVTLLTPMIEGNRTR